MEESRVKIFISDRCVLENAVCPAVIVVVGDKIERIFRDGLESDRKKAAEMYPTASFHDFGRDVVMSGVVDSHVHVNDPGRTDWEGFRSATRAAAVGGITTIVDMPLNSIPPTTTLDNLRAKAEVARKSAFVDVAFWGGVIPGNKKELRPMIDAGVVGFKCFLIPSGVEEFPHVEFQDVREALEELRSTGSLIAFHAECECSSTGYTNRNHVGSGDVGLYENFLESRPPCMEVEAIQKVISACKSSRVRCHVVHLSAAQALGAVAEAKQSGAPLTAETCHHYLNLDASQVPKGATEFKCCPPIRSKENQEKLWQALRRGTLDMVVSDHSPCTENLKVRGDFLSAWGGISSVQFGLSLMWTGARKRDFSLLDVSRYLSTNTARLCGLEARKGGIFEGADADFVVWQPEEKFTIRRQDILHKNKLTPYEGKEVFGRVRATFLRGRCIYQDGKLVEEPLGRLLLRNE